MPSNFTATVDLSDFDAAMKRIIAGQKRFPKDKTNPLRASMDWYLRALSTWWKRRPSVSSSGSWMGQRWPGWDQAYVAYERSDGKVPVWGGVKRMRTGRVTRVRDGLSTQRKVTASGMTKAEKAAGHGAVKLGQTFNRPNVLGKLKSDGSRYKQTDKQLGTNKGGGMLHDFVTGQPAVSANGKTVTKGTTKPYAAVQNEARPWTWSPQVERIVSRIMLERMKAYIVSLAKKRGAI